MAWLGRPGRVLVTHSLRTVQCVIFATCSALLSRTTELRSCSSRVGHRLAYCIWLKPGARLSAVAWPPARIASLMVQVPVWGSIASFVILLVMYMRHTASMAPG